MAHHHFHQTDIAAAAATADAFRPLRRGPRHQSPETFPREENLIRPVRRGPRFQSPRVFPLEGEFYLSLASAAPPYLLVIPSQNPGNVTNGRLRLPGPTHHDQSIYHDLGHVEAFLYYYYYAPSVSSGAHISNASAPAVPSTRGHNGGRPMYGFTDFEPTRRQNWIQQDETIIIGGENTAASASHHRGCGLSDELIVKNVKTKKCPARGTVEEEAADICVICQEDLSEGNETIGVLQCKHEYHVGCITQWLRQKNTCPLCKAAALEGIE